MTRPIGDDEIISRLESLKKFTEKDYEMPPTVESIEQRLANLRGVDVGVIRNPSSLVGNPLHKRNLETSESLINKVKAEVEIERKWSPGNNLKASCSRHHNIEIIDDNESAVSAVSSSGFDDILMSQGTVREMKDIERLLSLAQKESRKVNDEIVYEKFDPRDYKELTKLARQKSLKCDQINEEICRMWEDRIDKTDVDSNSNVSDVDEETIQKIIQNATNEMVESRNTVGSPKKTRTIRARIAKFFRQPAE